MDSNAFGRSRREAITNFYHQLVFDMIQYSIMVRLSLNKMLGNQILILPNFDIALVIEIDLEILDSSASFFLHTGVMRCFPIIGGKISGAAMPFAPSSCD